MNMCGGVLVHIIYAMSWNSHSKNPFHRKYCLIEFEQWSAASSLLRYALSVSSTLAQSHLLASYRIVYIYFCYFDWIEIFANIGSVCVCEIIRVSHDFIFRFWLIICTGDISTKKGQSRFYLRDVQVRERVSISWNVLLIFFSHLHYLSIRIYFCHYFFFISILFYFSNCHAIAAYFISITVCYSTTVKWHERSKKNTKIRRKKRSVLVN